MKEVSFLIQFFAVLGVMCVAAFLVPSVKYHKDDHHSVFLKISLGVAFVFLLSIAFDKVINITAEHFSAVRLIAATLAYMLRPALLYLLSLSIFRRKIKIELLVSIPLIINTILLIISIPTHCVFTFGDGNNFVRGPLGYYPIVMVGVYLAYLLFNVILLFRDRHIVEVIPLLFIVTAGVVFTILEFCDLGGVAFDCLMVIGTVFYSLLLNIYYSKRDSLTGLFNHQAYYSDSGRKQKQIKAVFSIDMNGLKVINDTEGHQEGDNALTAIAEAMERADHKRIMSRCYRIGGDEFAILCFSGVEKDVHAYMESIKDNVKKTKYSVSIGYYYRKNDNESIYDMYRLADKDMYQDKSQYYKKEE